MFKWRVIINIILSSGVFPLLLPPPYLDKKPIELTQATNWCCIFLIGGSGNNVVYLVLSFFFFQLNLKLGQQIFEV